jgi:hypothetical protein
MTPSGIEPATFRFVAQCIKQLPHCMPLFITVHVHLDRPNWALLYIFFFRIINVLCTSSPLSCVLHDKLFHFPYCHIPLPPTNFVNRTNLIWLINDFLKDWTNSSVANIRTFKKRKKEFKFRCLKTSFGFLSFCDATQRFVYFSLF